MKTKFNGILTLLLAFVVQLTFAQSKTISGSVSDGSDSLPGVSVIIKGTTTGTETDFDGNYSITANVGDVLQYSFVGMKTSEKTIGNANTIDVVLALGNILDEVVINVAYGEKKRKDIIGAVSVVTPEELGDRNVTTVTEALQGTAGLSMVNNTGQPGASPTIRIRGVGSLNSGLSPLIIVDGAQYSGNINAINFNDVASYSVLKDAYASALYGNRAANGVIIITTKKGGDTEGKSTVTIETSYGFSEKANDDYDYLSAEDILKTSWTADRNDRVSNGTPLAQANQEASAGLVNLVKANPYSIAQPIGTDGLLDPSAVLLYETDYLDALTQIATRQETSISVRGGTEKTKYFLSGSFLDTDGYTLLSKFKRYSGRINASSDVNKWLSFGGSMSVAFSESNVPIQAGSRFSNNIQYVRSVSSIYPLYQRNSDGSFILDAQGNQQYDYAHDRGFFGKYNPLSDTFGSQNSFERNTVDISPNVEIRVNDNLKFNSQFSTSFYLFEGNEFSNVFEGEDPALTPELIINGRSSQKERSTTKSYTITNVLSYNKSFNEKHNLSALLGHEMYNTSYNFLETTSTGFIFPELNELDNGNTPSQASSFTNQSRLFSYFSRVDYNFKEKYYVGVSLRRDASSRFIGDNKWGTFPSAAVAWSIYDEFFQNSDVVNTLKLRGSYGIVGNQEINNLFPYISEFGTGFNQLADGGIFPISEGNPNLKWETHNKLNIGLDFGFYNNRINGSIEVYDNRVEDLIYLAVPQPSTGSAGDGANALAPFINLGDISNKGIELTLNSTNIQTDDFKWVTSLAVSTNKNKIESLQAPEVTGSFRWEEGRDRYEFYMREWAGVNPANGEPLWYEEVTDPITSEVTKQVTNVYADATRVYTGKSALADIEGRLGTTFTYKNLDLGLAFNFKFGHYIYNSDYASLMKARNPGEQLSNDVLNAWENPGDITNVPVLTLGNDDFSARSTRWLQKGDYVRLKTISFGYNFNKALLKNLNVQKARIYFSADNYFTWKAEDNIDDPEQSFNGITTNSSTILKSLSLGLNVSF